MPRSWTTAANKRRLRAQLIERDGEACQHCGAGHVELTIDHRVARAEGGTNDLENLQLLCIFCNSSKGPREDKTVRFASSVMQSGFTMVPNVVLTNEHLTPLAKVLYALLVYYARQDEVAWPGQEKLAVKAACGERSLRDATRELEHGYLLYTRRRGQGRTNIYVLLDPKAPAARIPDRQILPVSDRQAVPPGSAGNAGLERRMAPVLKDDVDAVDVNAGEVEAPRPPQAGERPSKPEGNRQRDLARYLSDLAAWAPHPAELDRHVAVAWEAAAIDARDAVGEAAWASYLAPLHLHRVDGDVLVLGGSSETMLWAQERFGSLLAAAAARHIDEIRAIDIVPCTELREAVA